MKTFLQCASLPSILHGKTAGSCLDIYYWGQKIVAFEILLSPSMPTFNFYYLFHIFWLLCSVAPDRIHTILYANIFLSLHESKMTKMRRHTV